MRILPGILFCSGALFPLLYTVLFPGIDSGGRSPDDGQSIVLPAFTPWASIGGCGAGGSGSLSGDGITWIGNGVSGGLLDVEILPRYSFGQDFRFLTIAPRFSIKPTWTTTLGVSVPFSSKTAEVQYQSNEEAFDRTTGGLGDVGVDFSKSLGMAGDYSLSLSLSFPTGQYDIKRGSDRASRFLPAELQKGTGLYNAGLKLSKTIDVEDGMWVIDASYSFPFNMKPFTRKNEMLDTYFPDYKDRTDNSRFYYRAKPYGENDLGAYTPPGVSFSLYYGYRGIQNYVHSWGVTFSAPTGVAWINSEEVGLYDPRPDPDHKAWSAALIYGLEFSRAKFPVFLAVSLPIHDRTAAGDNPYDESPMKKWDAPDWGDFLQQWTLALGIKTTLF